MLTRFRWSRPVAFGLGALGLSAVAASAPVSAAALSAVALSAVAAPAAADCGGRPIDVVSAVVFDGPIGPDPLHASVDHDVDVPRITPAPYWRTDCRPLYRLDGRHPSVIFSQGFAPKDAA